MSIKTFLFDLDGTLVDTAKDLAWVLNQMLQQNNLPQLALETIKPAVSYGALAMLDLGFGKLEVEEQQLKKQQFLSFYKQNLAKHSHLFTGMSEFLSEQKSWGIVTNKSEDLTHPLLQRLNIKAQVVVCGDTLTKAKPHPEPLFHACKLLGVSVQDCVFVGDDINDIMAAKNANMKSIAVTYGYGQNPSSWGADYVVDNVEQLRNYYL